MNRVEFKTRSARIKTDLVDVPFLGYYYTIKRLYPKFNSVTFHMELLGRIELHPYQQSHTFKMFGVQWTVYMKEKENDGAQDPSYCK